MRKWRAADQAAAPPRCKRTFLAVPMATAEGHPKGPQRLAAVDYDQTFIPHYGSLPLIMATSIPLGGPVRDRLRTYGTAGMTYDEILPRLMDEVDRKAC